MHAWVRLLAFVVLAVSTSTPVSGDLRKLEVTVMGMDCAVCAHSIVTTLRRLEGVERVDVSLNRGMATIDCRPDNTLTIDDISRAIRSNGFRPQRARITAIGTLGLRDSTLVFEMKGGGGSVLAVEKDPANPGTYEAVYSARAASTRMMTGELTGLSVLGKTVVTTVTLQSFTELTVVPAHRR